MICESAKCTAWPSNISQESGCKLSSCQRCLSNYFHNFFLHACSRFDLMSRFAICFLSS
uniref:Uncharacterized protein n=1 Tax=Arundo donax TaxID=35708 RepID=A0A0A9HFS6_ARUDO